MRQIIYYLAFLKIPNYEYPVYQWYMTQVDPDKIDEFLTDIQIQHMENRLPGDWRWNIPFYIEWKLGGFTHLTYEI